MHSPTKNEVVSINASNQCKAMATRPWRRTGTVASKAGIGRVSSMGPGRSIDRTRADSRVAPW